MSPATDLPRTSNNQIRLGTIVELDLSAGRCRVQSGDVHTDYIPWLTPRTGETIEWSPPSLGEQVIVLAPGGDITGGVVLRGIYSDHFPAPTNTSSAHLVRYPDGALVQYDHASHALVATLPEGGIATITADGGVTVNGPLTVNGDTAIYGDVQVSQILTADTDVVGGGKSLKGHKHTAVQTGGGVSGPPQ